MKRKNFGFTLIELLVVIVIIGILATISTATFKQYFGKARDAARNTSVANITLMIKVDGADRWDDEKYIYSATSLQELFDANDYRAPKGENNICYVVAMAPNMKVVGDDNEFAVVTWGEETSTNDPTASGALVDGTSQAVANVLAGGLGVGDLDCADDDFDTVWTAFLGGDPASIEAAGQDEESPDGGYVYINESGDVAAGTTAPTFNPAE